MLEMNQLLLFVAAGWLLNLTPGPDVLYIVSHSLRSGWRAGIWAGLGITVGCLVHVGVAAAGVGALLAASTTAFTLLKWIGATYLLWMGIRMIAARPSQQPKDLGDTTHRPPDLCLRKVFWDGFCTNVLNPKVALFFLAFLPQFIAPDEANKTQAFLLLGLLFTLNSMPVSAGWALLASWMARNESVQRGLHALDKVVGALFLVFGIRLALAEHPGT